MYHFHVQNQKMNSLNLKSGVFSLSTLVLLMLFLGLEGHWPWPKHWTPFIGYYLALQALNFIWLRSTKKRIQYLVLPLVLLFALYGLQKGFHLLKMEELSRMFRQGLYLFRSPGLICILFTWEWAQARKII